MKRRNGFIQLTGMLTAVFLVGLYLALALSLSLIHISEPTRRS